MITLSEQLEKMKEVIARGRAGALKREQENGPEKPEEEAQHRPNLRGLPAKHAQKLAPEVFQENRPAVVAIKDFLASERPLVILSGDTGVGKSVAAGWAYANFRTKPQTVKWVHGNYGELEHGEAILRRPSSVRFVMAYKVIQAGTFDKDFWREVETPELLVIDELGSEPLDAKGMGVTNLTNILTHRHAHNLKTIVTTNAEWREFERTYCAGPGKRTLDRINEYPGKVFISLAGESMRGKPQEPIKFAPYQREPGED